MGIYTKWVELLELTRAKCKRCGKRVPKASLKEKLCVFCEISRKGDQMGSKKKTTKKKVAKKKK